MDDITGGISILLHDVISLPGETSCDKILSTPFMTCLLNSVMLICTLMAYITNNMNLIVFASVITDQICLFMNCVWPF